MVPVVRALSIGKLTVLWCVDFFSGAGKAELLKNQAGRPNHEHEVQGLIARDEHESASCKHRANATDFSYRARW